MGYEVAIFWGAVIGSLYLFAKKLESSKNNRDSRDCYTEAEEDTIKDD